MLNDLLARNVAWSQQRHAEEPDFFTRLAALQAPEFFWIGCSDSRVPANVVAGLDPGEVFVHRNVANVIHSTDMNLLSALEFAVDALHVREIIVCGHYGCGGVKAATEDLPHGLADHWLESIRRLACAYAVDLGREPDLEARRDRLAEWNVIEGVRRAGGAREAAQIWDVNTPMLAASLASAGVEIVASAHAADSLAGLVRHLGDLAARADLVITTGGISVGEEDHVKPAFMALGGELLFSGVAIKPGKSVSVGRIGKTHWLGLPGNPVSAFVSWQVFGMALVRALTGEGTGAPTRRHVVTAREIRRKPGRCELRPARLAGFDAHGREIVSFEDATHSARVGLLSQADGLMFLPADAECLPAGALVAFQPFCHS